MDRLENPELDGWIPVRLFWQDQQPLIDWCYLGADRFTAPFFTETVDDCMRLPFNLIFRHQTPIEVLGHRHQTQPGLQPTGFIFHMSRCGSTLMSQMLAALTASIAISEAPPIDSALRSNFHSGQATEVRRVEWLRWLISALGQPRVGNEKHIFIKFDAWNVLHFPLIRQAFPDVPWVFLYRDPVEVMVSQLSRRGAHMIPGVIAPELFGMDLAAATSLSPEDYCAQVLAGLCRHALEHHRNGGRLINYTQLPEVIWSSIFEFFGVSVSEGELDNVKEAAKQNAKNPSMTFVDDGARKREQATPAIQKAAEQFLYPVYEQLEEARKLKFGL
jgi:gluconate kinase